MKILTLIFIFILCTVSAYSQRVTVIDKATLQPVKDVHFASGSDTVTTNLLGQADISSFTNGEPIYITAPDYFSSVLTYPQIQTMGFKVPLSFKMYRTDEIVISGNKFDVNSKYLPRQMDVMKSTDIKFANTQTTADLLQNTGDVFVQKSQQEGGSPVLRGFEANKVLIMVDGIRMNNIIFRGGHLQNVLRVDGNMLDRMEVLYGAGSTLYGSDALGGVLSFYTKDPVFSLNGKALTSGSALLRYSSADQENTGHINLNVANDKVGFFGGFNYSKFDALTMGADNVKNEAWYRKYIATRINGIDSMVPTNNYYSQDPSGYTQYDVLGKFLIKQSQNVNHTLNFQYSTTNDVPRYDRLNTIDPGTGDFTQAQWYYGPEKRLLASYKLGLIAKGSFYSDAKFILAYQGIKESRNTRGFGSSTFKARNEDVNVYSANFDFNKIIKNHNLSYGLEGTYNTLTSTATATNVNTGATKPTDTRYPDGDNNMTTLAAYIQDLLKINNTIYTNFGIRYNWSSLKATFIDTSFFHFQFPEVDQTNGGLSGNLGFTFLPEKDWRIYVNGSTGYRTPNTDDLAKIFETAPGSVIVPNSDLGPEYTYGVELGVSKLISGWVRAGAVGYYTWINDGIVTAPFTFNGKDSIIYDGVLSAVLANQNAQSAHIWGVSVNLNADVTDYLTLENTFNYTYGRINTDSTDYPLDHIPPPFGKSAVVVNVSKFRGEFNILYNAWKLKKDYNMPGEDNFADATPDGMPNWFTLNVSSAYQFNRYFAVQLDINNILDQNYRTFSSGINGPGVNSVLSLRGNF